MRPAADECREILGGCPVQGLSSAYVHRAAGLPLPGPAALLGCRIVIFCRRSVSVCRHVVIVCRRTGSGTG